MTQAHYPALLIATPASGQGKATVTTALTRLHARQEWRIRASKYGLDLLDSMILARVSGVSVYQLDLWVAGEAEARRLLVRVVDGADLALIEGVTDLFDNSPSATDLAWRFGVPVLGVIGGVAMTRTFGALAYGLAHFQPDLPLFGVLGNHIGSQCHGDILCNCLPPGIRWFGSLPRSVEFELPSRHLGLIRTEKLADPDVRLDTVADALRASVETDLLEPVTFEVSAPAPPQHSLEGMYIGVAHGTLFVFLYQADLDLLRELDAELMFLSPLQDQVLPAVDSLYLPGGYPELHLGCLQGNRAMAEAIRAHRVAGKPLPAECDGMPCLPDYLEDADGECGKLLDLLPGQARLQRHLTALASQEVELPKGWLCGHTFHHSTFGYAVELLARGVCPNGRSTAEAVFCPGRLTTSYIHFYLPPSSQAIAVLLAPARGVD